MVYTSDIILDLEKLVEKDQFKEVLSLILQNTSVAKEKLTGIIRVISEFKTLEKERTSFPIEGKNYPRSYKILRNNCLREIYALNELFAIENELIENNEDYTQDEKISEEFQEMISEPEKQPLKVFVSYAQKDKTMIEMMKSSFSNLVGDGTIELWYDGELLAGEEWEPKIFVKLESADIIFLLVSQFFMESIYCMKKELPKIVNRHNNPEDHLIVIPTYLNKGDYKGAVFESFQSIPKMKKCIDSFKNIKTGWNQAAIEFRELILKLNI